MPATTTRAPRLRLSRDTVRRLAVSPRATGLEPLPPTTGCFPTRDCDVTFGCTQFGACAPTDFECVTTF
jgi:hypothetical protein